ncbi:hypothetical protein GX50_04958 [[Emmonsia] crescens]|uniref:Uncharacterized protein n=1 Tax=[Emmonsia] crescens TaxID=73230 RepID=A0A2B7ZFZ6_9EURO|nr:hypothetical protein GX50_04958 [Emmonsia crescens]
MSATVAGAEYLVGLLTEFPPEDGPARETPITFDVDDPGRNRLPVVLDAIANVLRSDDTGGQITLKLATNKGELPERTLQHAQYLLNRLQGLGKRFCDMRKELKQDQDQERTNWMDETSFPRWLQDDYTIFHSARFDGGFINLGGTSPARKGLLTRLQKLAEDEDLRKEIARLQHIGRVLCWMLGVLNDDPSELPPADLDRMADGMAIICNETEVLLKDKSFLEIYSRREDPIKLRLLPPSVPQIPGPDEFLTFNACVIHRDGSVFLRLMVGGLMSLNKSLPELSIFSKKVIRAIPLSLTSAYQNSPACRAGLFLKALREAGHVFHTKGSHSKAYFSWKYPYQEIVDSKLCRDDRDKILRSFFNTLAETYVTRFGHQRGRAYSDSSTGSFSSVTRDVIFDF